MTTSTFIRRQRDYLFGNHLACCYVLCEGTEQPRCYQSA